jgi:hypothetical protein
MKRRPKAGIQRNSGFGLNLMTDDELNDDFNTYIAQHYGRYVLVYLLPILLMLAWLNSIFDEQALQELVGMPYVLPAPQNSFGVEGLSVTFIFLATYIVSLVIGFRIKKMLRSSA